jgi:hypothetical protein
MIDTVKPYSAKWGKMSASDKKKYEESAEKDVERYNQHLELVKRHILQKPLHTDFSLMKPSEKPLKTVKM